MENIATSHDISFVAELHQFGIDSRPFRRAERRGDAVRIHRGAYMSAEAWRGLDRREQYRHQVIAAAGASRTHPVLSHQSAAVIWGIPLVGPLPRLIHVLATASAGTRTEGAFRRHASRYTESEVDTIDGVAVTSLCRTVIDLALTVPFPAAVAAVDWAIREDSRDSPQQHSTLEELYDVMEILELVRGQRRVNRALEFANGLSGSAGESLSRAVIHELGFPAPVLQHRFDDRLGLIGYTDFWWPQFRLIGEFDGLIKYTRDAFHTGLSIEEVVVAEKKREDRLRALGPRVSRWLWPDVMSPRLLQGTLSDAGLPSTRRVLR